MKTVLFLSVVVVFVSCKNENNVNELLDKSTKYLCVDLNDKLEFVQVKRNNGEGDFHNIYEFRIREAYAGRMIEILSEADCDCGEWGQEFNGQIEFKPKDSIVKSGYFYLSNYNSKTKTFIIEECKN